MLSRSLTEKLKSQRTEANTGFYDSNNQSYISSTIMHIVVITFSKGKKILSRPGTPCTVWFYPLSMEQKEVNPSSSKYLHFECYVWVTLKN